MKILARLLVMVFCICICANCEGKKNMSFQTLDQKNLDVGKTLVECLITHDQETLYSLFSKEVQMDSMSLKKDISRLLSIVNAKIEKYEEYSKSVDTKIRDSKSSFEYHTTYILWINGMEYILRYIYTAKNSFDINTEGIRSLRIVKKVDKDKYFCYWQDMEPGIFIPEE